MKRGLCLILAVTSCASGVHRIVHAPRVPLSITAVVVYAPRVTGTVLPAWREYELGERLVGTAVSSFGDRLAFFGPTEVKVLRWEDDAAWVGSDAVALLVRSAIRPEQALVLRASVEKRVSSQVQESRDPTGRRRGAWSTEETTWVGRVELLHPSSAAQLVEVTGQVTVDPFAPPSGEEDFDPAPAMTHLLERLVEEALFSASSSIAERAPAPRLGVTLAETPAATAALPDPEVAKLDSLASEMWIENRARFLTPTLPERAVSSVAKARPGLWVLVAPGGASVRPGDLVIEVDGAPPLPQVLARKRIQGTPVPVRVQRGSIEIDAVIP